MVIPVSPALSALPAHPLKRKTMKAVLSLAVAIACCACAQASDSLRVSTRLVAVAPGFSSTSVNTAVFRNNSLVTDRDVQFIAFYDGDGYLVVGKRAVDSEEWTLCRSKYKGNVGDAHNVISLMVDGDGYVHVAFDHHNSRLRYCRGIAPHSVELGEEEQMTGDDEAKLTYPEFYRLADGGLLFVYRSGTLGEGNLVMNRYDIKTHRWSRLHVYVQRTSQGDGERTVETKPQTVYVLEVSLDVDE